jgi:hypothetical protein
LASFPKRRTVAISAAASFGAVALALFFTNAHNSPLDELGCHRDPPGSRYHCHTGALKGREFNNKDEAQRSIASVQAQAQDSDFAVTYEDNPDAAREKVHDKNLAKDAQLPPPPDLLPKAVVHEKLLKVISWNVKKGEKVDYDRIVNVLMESDIAVLQGLDLDEKGKGPLHIIGDLLQGRINEKICRMWFRNSAQGREKYGILWRNSTVGYVDESGNIKERCGEMAVVVPTNKGKGAAAVAASLFFSKVQKKMFQLGTVFLDKRQKNPKRDVPGLFKPLESSNFPTVVVGDVKFQTSDIKKWNFKSSIARTTVAAKKDRGSKSSTGNIWSRNAVVVRGVHVNLYDRFAELPTKDIDTSVSASFPMLAEVALVPELDDNLQTMVIKAKKEKEKAAPKKEPVEAKGPADEPRENFDEPDDNIEEEANRADSDDERGPAASKSKKKKSKKKKR